MLLLLLLAEALRVLPNPLVIAVLEELLIIIILALVLEVSKPGRSERLVASLVTHGMT